MPTVNGMRTETSPRRAPSAPSRTLEVAAWVLMVAGFALTVAGILQVAGLWALGAGFVVIFVASGELPGRLTYEVQAHLVVGVAKDF